MKTLKLSFLSLLLVLGLVLAPAVSFANNTNSQDNYGNGVKAEAHAKVDTSKSSSKNKSWWGRLFGFFGTRVNAAKNNNQNNNQNKKPTISGITAPTVLKTGAEGTWTVKASDPSNSSLTYAVDWNDNSAQPFAKSAQSAFVQTSTFTHAYNNPGTYTVKFTVTNEANLQTTSSVTVHVTGKNTEQDKPVIKSLDGQKNIKTGDTETVTVNAYDPKNDSLSYAVNWGDTSFLKALTVSEPVFVQSATFDHVYNTAGTYTATFTVQNSAGKKTSSSIDIKVTNSADITNPVISNLVVTAITSNSAQISWTTDESSTTKVFFSTNTPVDVSSAPAVSNSSLVTSHSIVISGLNANTVYHFIVNSSDSSTNTAASSESSFTTSS